MTAAPRSLVASAADVLRPGPRHTLELAREVMGLSGNPSAASAAVFTLLGADARFRVDGRGMWSLADAGVRVGTSLDEGAFAVVDVETTGGSFDAGHRIMEIAVVEVRGGAITAEYQTLVHPGRSIPFGVCRLTGISDGMVADAPSFEHVAETVLARLRGRVFVAHNARFDWGFVSGELTRALGEAPALPRLCTVRMARRLLPRLRRRNLDALATHYDVPIRGRHRAYGDAFATARIFIRLLDEARARGVADLEALEEHLSRPRRAARGGGRRRGAPEEERPEAGA